MIPPAEPGTLVIFGATGDLTRRKLAPALYNLRVDGLLAEPFAVVGYARRDLDRRSFVNSLAEGVAEHSRRGRKDEAWAGLAPAFDYCRGSFDDPEGYRSLSDCLARLERERGIPGNRLFYLATPPSAFPSILENLREAGLHRPGHGGSWARVVVEKPIGRDFATARSLNDTINRSFPEENVFRIDHYLGKETVQNLLVFRFANAIWEPLWNTKYVDHVQITVSESIGVEGRGSYFEEAGMTRDVVQNHLFQLVCLTAMEPPVSLAADCVRDEKVKVLRQLRPLEAGQVAVETVRARYGPGKRGDEEVPGYLGEPGVAPGSTTETYMAQRLFIDSWRWAGVPFYLRAGKALASRVTEIYLCFRDVPHRLFTQAGQDGLAPNSLALRIQPDEGIALRFEAKEPGPEGRIRPVTMDFGYETSFAQSAPEAYERLILDAILGDSTLFIRRDEVELAWKYIDRLFEGWRLQGATDLPEYAAGTPGPAEADTLIGRTGRAWRRL